MNGKQPRGAQFSVRTGLSIPQGGVRPAAVSKCERRIARPIVRARDCRGFSYLLLLFAVALIGVGLAGAGVVWQTEAQRDKERELIFAGTQIAQAVAGYYNRSPGEAKQLPRSFDDLLEDERFPFKVRHLRRRYRDPFGVDGAWEVLREGDRIIGVASTSEREALGLPPDSVELGGPSGARPPVPASGGAQPPVTRYRDWHFVFRPPATQAQPAQAAAPNSVPTPAAAVGK